MKKPSLKIIVLSAILVLGVATISYALFGKSSKKTYTTEVASEVTVNPILAKDTDSDNLKDWEEQLWKTDPNNSDTDGDGANDGEEIKSGRNPLIFGPNDKLDSETVAKKVNQTIDEDLTDTDKFSRELFLKIIAAKQSGLSPEDAGFDEFLNTTIRNEVEKQQPEIYTAEDFKVDSVETPEKIKAYGNTIAAILREKPPQKLEHEIDIVIRADENKNPSELKKLDGNIAAYERLGRALLGLSVPRSSLSYHMAFTNATSAMAWSITGLKYILTDPIKALPGASVYADNVQSFFAAAQAFKNYFDSNSITFNPGDDGYQFFDAL